MPDQPDLFSIRAIEKSGLPINLITKRSGKPHHRSSNGIDRSDTKSKRAIKYPIDQNITYSIVMKSNRPAQQLHLKPRKHYQVNPYMSKAKELSPEEELRT